MKNVFSMKSISAAVVAGILILASCAKNNDVLNSGDVQNVNSESVSDSYTSETSDMGASAVNAVTNSQYGGARIAGDITALVTAKDPRLTGATITITPDVGSTKDSPSGTIVINFGAGVTTNGVTRTGQIIISYIGRKWKVDAQRAITFSGYSRNNVQFDDGDKITITNVTDSLADKTIKYHHVLSGNFDGFAKLSFPGGSTILRQSDFYVTLDYTALTLTLSATTAPHSASGTTRAGIDYTMDITDPIVYKATCLASKVFIPVSGTKIITAGREYKIEYGNGDCDNTVTITVGGKSATITVNGDGN